MNLHLLFEFGVVHVVCSEFFHKIIHESPHERLLSGQSVGGLLSSFILSEFDKLDVTEGDSEDSHIPKWSIFGSALDGSSDLVVLSSPGVVVLLLFFFFALRDLSGCLEVVWCCSVHVLLHLVDFEIAGHVGSILRQG